MAENGGFSEGLKRHFAVLGADGGRSQTASLPDLTSVESGCIEPPFAPPIGNEAPFFTDVGTDWADEQLVLIEFQGPISLSLTLRAEAVSPWGDENSGLEPFPVPFSFVARFDRWR
jgi:hypothetical protein